MGQRPRWPKLVPDAVYPGMWRVRWPDGRLSDMANLARATDAIACFMETEERRQRGRQSPSEGRLCIKNESARPPRVGAGDAVETHTAKGSTPE